MPELRELQQIVALLKAIDARLARIERAQTPVYKMPVMSDGIAPRGQLTEIGRKA